MSLVAESDEITLTCEIELNKEVQPKGSGLRELHPILLFTLMLPEAICTCFSSLGVRQRVFSTAHEHQGCLGGYHQVVNKFKILSKQKLNKLLSGSFIWLLTCSTASQQQQDSILKCGKLAVVLNRVKKAVCCTRVNTVPQKLALCCCSFMSEGQTLSVISSLKKRLLF